MPRAIVIGYGNPSRRDDGAGHYVIEKIQRLSNGQIDCLFCHQLGIELIETIKDYDLVIFVDAYVGERSTGLEVAPLEAVYSPSAFTHFVNSSSLIALTKSLYHKEPQALLVSIRGYDFDFGTQLSPKTRKWADIAVERIFSILDAGC